MDEMWLLDTARLTFLLPRTQACPADRQDRVNTGHHIDYVRLSDPLHSAHPDPYSPPMDLSSLSMEQLKELVQGLVDDRIRELIGDPDLGLQLGDSLRTRLKQSLASGERLSGEDMAERLGLRW
jgi:hypothetical protein